MSAPPEPTIYERLIDLIENAETADEHNHPVEALIELQNAGRMIASHLSAVQN